MSLTTQEVLDLHALEVAKGKSPDEALQGARCELHAALLDRHPPPERDPAHDDDEHHEAHANHSADKWEVADVLLHAAGVGPAPRPLTVPRVIASISGRATASGGGGKAS